MWPNRVSPRLFHLQGDAILPGCHSCSVCAQGACREGRETGVTCDCPPGRSGALCDQTTSPNPCQNSRWGQTSRDVEFKSSVCTVEPCCCSSRSLSQSRLVNNCGLVVNNKSGLVELFLMILCLSCFGFYVAVVTREQLIVEEQLSLFWHVYLIKWLKNCCSKIWVCGVDI